MIDWKELFYGISIILMGLFLFFFGFAFYLIGRNLYGTDASLIWVGGMLVIISIYGIVGYYVNLYKEGRNDR